MSRISVCALVHAPPARVAATLEPLRELKPEIVLAVDDRVEPEWTDENLRLADRVILVPFPGWFSRIFAWLRGQCSGEWLLHVDDDEVPGSGLAAEVAETVARKDVTHAWIRRRWLYPDGRTYLDQWPWSPAYGLRLMLNDPRLVRFPGRFHEVAAAVGPRRFLHAPLYHAPLLLSSEEERARRVAHYEAGRPGLVIDGRPFNEAYYLPERRSHVRTAPVPQGDVEVVKRFLAADAEVTGRTRGRLERAAPADLDRNWEGRELRESAYQARLRLLDRDLRIVAGESRAFDVEIENLGDDRWPGGIDANPEIKLGYRWLGDGVPERDGGRTTLPASVGPGERILVPVHVRGPADPGEHTLELDLVHEHVRWFGLGLRITLVVQPPATGADGTMDTCFPRPSRTSSRS